MDRLLAGREYASHLTDADLQLLASVADAEGPGQLTSAGDPVDDASRLRSDPEALLRLIEHPGAFRAVLGPADATRGWVDSASPFLVFAAVVQQAGRRTRRFSELDPVRLAGLLDAVPEAERPGVYRRLGACRPRSRSA